MRVLRFGIAVLFAGGERAYSLWGRLRGRARTQKLVVLMYHGVSSKDRARFAQQMEWLQGQARLVRADCDVAALGASRLSVAITFDDAYQSFVDNALPELTTRGIPAVVFVPTGYLGSAAGWVTHHRGSGDREKVLDAPAIKSLREQGVLVGSHSVTHCDLAQVDRHQVWTELNESRQTLEGVVEHPVRLFACPYGSISKEVIESARSAGYTRVFLGDPTWTPTSIEGLTAGRIGVSPEDWGIEFHLKARGAYRWLPWAIRAKRWVREHMYVRNLRPVQLR